VKASEVAALDLKGGMLMKEGIVGSMGGEDGINDTSNFVGRGAEALGGDELGSHATVIVAEFVLGVMTTLSGHAQRVRATIGASPGYARKAFAGTGAIVGAQAQPGAKMFYGGKRPIDPSPVRSRSCAR